MFNVGGVWDVGDIVRINDSQSRWHKQKAVVTVVGKSNSFYIVETLYSKLSLTVVPQQLLASKREETT